MMIKIDEGVSVQVGMSLFRFFPFYFRYIDMCIDQRKQAVLIEERYRYNDMDHIHDTLV